LPFVFQYTPELKPLDANPAISVIILDPVKLQPSLLGLGCSYLDTFLTFCSSMFLNVYRIAEDINKKTDIKINA